MKKFDGHDLMVNNVKINNVKIIKEKCYYCGKEIDESKGDIILSDNEDDKVCKECYDEQNSGDYSERNSPVGW